MGIGKARAALSQPIDVGRLHHRMPAEVADPIVLIINGDHQDIGFLIFCREGEGQEGTAQE